MLINYKGHIRSSTYYVDMPFQLIKESLAPQANFLTINLSEQANITNSPFHRVWKS